MRKVKIGTAKVMTVKIIRNRTLVAVHVVMNCTYTFWYNAKYC